MTASPVEPLTITYRELDNSVVTLTRDEWLSRCAAEYVKRADLGEPDAANAAAECLRIVEDDPTCYADESPEDMANDDMDCWTDDGDTNG